MARYMDWYGRCRFPLQVGFRVEVHDAEHQSENNTFRRGEGSMVARDPSRDLDDDAFRDHLTWGSRRAGPLISFTSNWNRAMERRKRFIEDKAQNIVVIAVWLEGLEVYDAYDVARHLPMKRPEQHLDEFLLYGNICADSYRILAMFHGVLEPENVTLSPQGWVFEASVPGGFAHPTRTGTLRNATEDFRDETYSLTGIKGGVKLDSLLRSIG
ncbi:hypothetical protein VDGL01_08332 [Verticillium dahliae]